jgi:hypothetical protein
MADHAVASASYLGAPDRARGMASCNLACAPARAGQPEQATAALSDAIVLNPDLRANASRDPDLASFNPGVTERRDGSGRPLQAAAASPAPPFHALLPPLPRSLARRGPRALPWMPR